MLELLLPAGNLKKLKTAFHFGADAVYAGGKNLSLRAYADNFSLDELREGVEYAHSLGKKVYVTANIVAKNSDLSVAEEFFKYLQDIHADAVLISDVGLLSLCKEVAPSLTIHLSTQANTANALAAKFWQSLGVKRIVLARELSLEEIKEIHTAVPDLEIEAFVHGAMCISYSGRCLLSSYFSSRSSNRGECIQPCRFGYHLTETESGKPLDVEEDEKGTYLLNSCDLKLISRIPELHDAGVVSLKVEGRMKSEYYVATVATAYRQAIDEYLEKGKIENIARYDEILDNISHRPYTEAYLDGNNLNTVSFSKESNREKFRYTASVLHCALANGVNITPCRIKGHNISHLQFLVTVEMRNRFKTGDVIEVLSPSATSGTKFIMGDIIYSQDNTVTDDAKLVQSVYSFLCPVPLLQNDILLIERGTSSHI